MASVLRISEEYLGNAQEKVPHGTRSGGQDPTGSRMEI